MTRWTPLPVAIEPQVRDLATRLRELRDNIGITTTALARKTAYSRSSWARSLNGRTVPPRAAVEAFGQLAGMAPTDPDMARLLALWELASQVRRESNPAQDVEQVSDASMLAPPGVWWGRRWSRVAALAIAAVAGAAAVAIAGVITLWAAGGQAGAEPQLVPVSPAGYSCHYTELNSQWYSGHSTTSIRLVAFNGGGEDVVEVQCLLKHHGFDPGRVDGLFGPNTEQAVKQLQSTAGIVVDGMVGPQTWAVLRG
jgi:transcriptional regulator with XRE-family HTH domain